MLRNQNPFVITQTIMEHNLINKESKLGTKHNLRLTIKAQLLAFMFLSIFGVTELLYAKEKAVDTFSNTYQVKKIKLATVETTNGAISVTGYEGEEIIIDAEFVVTGRKKKVCEELVKKMELKVHIDNNSFEIDTDFKSKMGYSSSVSIYLKIPHRLKAECESKNGGIFVENVTGGVELETTNGGIKCENVSGGVEVETVNGGVSLKNIEGNTNASTVNGGLLAEFSKTTPDQVSLETVNGRVSVSFANTPNGTVHASTINGSLKISGKKVPKT